MATVNIAIDKELWERVEKELKRTERTFHQFLEEYCRVSKAYRLSGCNTRLVLELAQKELLRED